MAARGGQILGLETSILIGRSPATCRVRAPDKLQLKASTSQNRTRMNPYVSIVLILINFNLWLIRQPLKTMTLLLMRFSVIFCDVTC